jgi:hypothetical protein
MLRTRPPQSAKTIIDDCDESQAMQVNFVEVWLLRIIERLRRNRGASWVLAEKYPQVP